MMIINQQDEQNREVIWHLYPIDFSLTYTEITYRVRPTEGNLTLLKHPQATVMPWARTGLVRLFSFFSLFLYIGVYCMYIGICIVIRNG